MSVLLLLGVVVGVGSTREGPTTKFEASFLQNYTEFSTVIKENNYDHCYCTLVSQSLVWAW